MNPLNGVKQVIAHRSIRFVIAALALVTLTVSASAQQFAIGPYHLQKSTRVSLTQYDYTYTADLTDSGGDATNVVGTVTSNTPSTIVTKGTVTFGAIASGATITSVDTFTIRQDRTVAFDPASLAWTFSAPQRPTAIANYSQTVHVGETVKLDGTRSTDPNGTPLTYQWTLISAPPGDPASIEDPILPVSELFIGQQGTYVVQLVVNDGTSNSDPAIVTLSMTSTPPTANAGQNQHASVGTAVQLDGSQSIDPDGNPITFAWSILSAPNGSAASISDTNVPLPSFAPDLPGSYVVQLIVTDKNASSTPSTVTFSTTHIPPIANVGGAANLGGNQFGPIGTTVLLDASLSTDPNGLPLTYSWALISKPDGSTANLANPTAVHPSFRMDVNGIYVAQLIVSDALGTSLPAALATFTVAPPPLADAGPDQTVPLIQRGVDLNGYGSTDYVSPPGFYSWSILYQPQANQVSFLSNPNIPNPSFPLYNKGTYVVQLISGDGIFRSLPSTVVINVLDVIQLLNLVVGNDAFTGSLVSQSSAGMPGEVVTITSSDPTHFLFAASPGGIGASTITLPLGEVNPTVFVQGQNFSGTAPITATYTASAPGFMSGTAMLTLYPTGWYLNTAGSTVTTTPLSGSLFLGPELTFLDPATLAGPTTICGCGVLGHPQAGPVSIPVTNSNSAVGTLSGSSSIGTLQFNPLAPGSTVVTMTEPPGFFTPSNEPLQTTITVTPDQVGLSGYSRIGNNARSDDWVVTFTAMPPVGQTVTITSSDPIHFLLLSSPTGLGAASIVIPTPTGPPNSSSGNGHSFFEVLGQNISGTTPITGYLTASTPNYLSAPPVAVTLYPTGLVIAVPGPDPLTHPSVMLVGLALLNPVSLTSTNVYVPAGPQAPPIPVAVTTSNSSVVGISGNPSSIPVGDLFALGIMLVPSAAGTATITVIEPPGYFTPSDGSNQIVTTTIGP